MTKPWPHDRGKRHPGLRGSSATQPRLIPPVIRPGTARDHLLGARRPEGLHRHESAGCGEGPRKVLIGRILTSMLSTEHILPILRALVQRVSWHQEPMPVNAGDPYVVDGASSAFHSTAPLRRGGHGASGASHDVKVLIGEISGVGNILVVYRHWNVNGHGIPFYGARGYACALMADAMSGQRDKPRGVCCGQPLGSSASDGQSLSVKSRRGRWLIPAPRTSTLSVAIATLRVGREWSPAWEDTAPRMPAQEITAGGTDALQAVPRWMDATPLQGCGSRQTSSGDTAPGSGMG
jgi:hypothetical protein